MSNMSNLISLLVEDSPSRKTDRQIAMHTECDKYQAQTEFLICQEPELKICC